eukprot:TRINITY_DN26820_c0_g3_i1.p1 TRINITY_DN26820_c0_g3~~TRINITY_DN26820_c0_g3_i1.p1  ORF type:complete len:666 (+),score=57.36 TRINITY_DN26820_c0_g3_i1:65-2062(+)
MTTDVECAGIVAPCSVSPTLELSSLERSSDDQRSTSVTEGTPLHKEWLYPFHHASIHEHRCAAYVARAIPLTIIVSLLVVVSLGAVSKYRYILLFTSAFFNVWMWLWLVSYSLFALWGTRVARKATGVGSKTSAELSQTHEADTLMDPAVHLVILPNYKEDESVLAITLEALTEAEGSEKFYVVLAMEEREGMAAAERGHSLQARFSSRFAEMAISTHPVQGLEQKHNDGSVTVEIPGKSSNLRWAVDIGQALCAESGISDSRVILTVADADCVFHPQYFAQLGGDFDACRAAAGTAPVWAMWQAPQLPFSNLAESPAPSRVWGYVAAMYEFGGVQSLSYGGRHMTFSSFSLPLELSMDCMPWDGDVIADDHHCYLKSFLYSTFCEGQAIVDSTDGCHSCCSGKGARGPLQLKPIMLPVKTTSVVAKNCMTAWKARYNQATRHAMGVAELSYVLLAVWDLLRTLPWRAYSLSLLYRLCRVVSLPFHVNLLPILHAIPFGMLTSLWLIHGGQLPECPTGGPHSIWLHFDDYRFYLCALAGSFNLTVPLLIPICLLLASNYCIITNAFLLPTHDIRQGQVDGNQKPSTVWQREDGAIAATFGSKRLSLWGLLVFDVFVLMPIIMPIYGALPVLKACVHVLLHGNHFDFRSASKVGKATPHLVVEAEV